KDTDTAEVVVRVLCGNRSVPEYSIRKTGVSQILPCHVVKRLGSVVRSHTVDLHDNEAEFSERLRVHTECFWYERTLRSREDAFYDGILFGRIEVERPMHDSPDVGLSISSHRSEYLGRTPSGGEERGNIRAL